MAEDERKIAALRDKLQGLLLKEIPGLVINGEMSDRRIREICIFRFRIFRTVR